MALLEMGATKLTIPVGEVSVGSDAACAIRLTGAGILPKHAVLQGLADGQVVIRKAAPQADVLINGVRLGAEPTPLLHGDKVEVGGHELTFVDERRSGSTQFLQAVAVPQAAAQAKAAAQAGRATAATGGRVVCLTDGREYLITGTSLVFGREAGCDVVVPGKDVSRQHAEIMATPKGYLLVDSSTNGTFVNDAKVEGQRILARADVIRMGEESFRFYADEAPAPAVAARPAAAAPAGAGAPPPSSPAAPARGASERLKETMHGVPEKGAAPAPAPARPSQAGPLASFLIRSGEQKGQRLSVRTPVVNIGRAEYNDLVLSDGSVSTSHAKLQRREGIWVLVDLESTNGTFVDGERVTGEMPLAPGASVRFGDVSLVFEPTDDALGVAKGGGTVVLGKEQLAGLGTAPAPFVPAPPKPAPVPEAPKAKPAAPAPPPPRARPSPAKPQPKRPTTAPPPEKKAKGCGTAVIVLGGVGMGAAFVFWILA